MKKIRMKWIRVLTFVVMISLTIGTFTTISALGDLSKKLKPSNLFTVVSGFTLQSNQDVPDYMRYGAVYKNGSVYKIDKNSSDDFLADWETNGVKVTTTVTNKTRHTSHAPPSFYLIALDYSARCLHLVYSHAWQCCIRVEPRVLDSPLADHCWHWMFRIGTCRPLGIKGHLLLISLLLFT